MIPASGHHLLPPVVAATPLANSQRRKCKFRRWLAAATSAAAAAMVALSLHGCAEEEGFCPLDFEAFIPDYKPSFERLDRLTGCKDEWNAAFGNPCASDVPVAGGTKGLYRDADLDWVLSDRQNTLGNCTAWYPGGGCREWMESNWGCEKDEINICLCDAPSGGLEPGVFCSSWGCVTKRSEHRSCWEDDWDESYSSSCDKNGAWAWNMDWFDFEDVLAAEGAPNAINANLSRAQRIETLIHRQKPFTMSQDNQNICVISVKPEDDKKPCDPQWRMIETKFLECLCTKPAARYCEEWKCNTNTEVGNKEWQTHTCKEALSDGSKCGLWQSEKQGWEISEVQECRACMLPNCHSWICTEYAAMRLIEFRNQDWGEEGNWWERLGFAIVHFLWIGVFYCVVGISGAAVAMPDGGNDGPRSEASWAKHACCCLCQALVMVFCAFSIYLLGFLRWQRDSDPLARHSWRAPWGPWHGAFFTVLVAWLFAICVSTFSTRTADEVSTVFAVGCCGALLVGISVGLTWTIGLLGASPLLLLTCFYSCVAVFTAVGKTSE